MVVVVFCFFYLVPKLFKACKTKKKSNSTKQLFITKSQRNSSIHTMSDTQGGQIEENTRFEGDLVKDQAEYPFSAPIRREDVESNVDNDVMEVEEVCGNP